MKNLILLIAVLFNSAALAAEGITEKDMKIELPSFPDNSFIPAQFAFCIPSEKGHVQPGMNKNPEIQFTNVPSNAKSLTLVVVDTDAPSEGNNVNKEGFTVSQYLPRIEFYHWVLINIPPSVKKIRLGEDSNAITAHGKPARVTAYGTNGINDYTKWFAHDKNMAGQYGGYDGPCPPWNDKLPHHLHFRLYALDIKKLDLGKNFDGQAVMTAIHGHIVAQSEWVGVYSLNPKVIPYTKK